MYNKIKSALDNKRRHMAHHDATATSLRTIFTAINLTRKPQLIKEIHWETTRSPLSKHLKYIEKHRTCQN